MDSDEIPSDVPLCPMPSSIRAHFESTEWCRKYLDSDTYQPMKTFWWDGPTPKIPIALFTQTLKNNDAIIACQSFWKLAEESEPTDSHELISLYKFGPGASGARNTAHGGLVSTILDQGMGTLAGMDPDCQGGRTAELTVRYHGPVVIPGVVLCRARIHRKEKRKVWAKGTIETEKEGKKTILASSDGLFIVKVKERI